MNLASPRLFITASFLLAIAVMIGAFGAHGLEGKISQKALDTYQTGVTYHFYHALALLSLSAFHHQKIYSKLACLFIALGILLFSFNCYLYALTGIKTFAMIVPLGGLSFILGWLTLGFGQFCAQKRP
jgi:uncharacterized membrane protein YgdD (TMEM256/DUF423 family)